MSLICNYYIVPLFFRCKKKRQHIDIIYQPLAALLSEFLHQPLKNPIVRSLIGIVTWQKWPKVGSKLTFSVSSLVSSKLIHRVKASKLQVLAVQKGWLKFLMWHNNAHVCPALDHDVISHWLNCYKSYILCIVVWSNLIFCFLLF